MLVPNYYAQNLGENLLFTGMLEVEMGFNDHQQRAGALPRRGLGDLGVGERDRFDLFDLLVSSIRFVLCFFDSICAPFLRFVARRRWRWWLLVDVSGVVAQVEEARSGWWDPR